MQTQNEMLNFPGLEQKLSSLLRPVNPNPEFVNRLRHSLGNTSVTVVERSKTPMLLLVLGMGLFSGVFLIWLAKKLKG